MSTQHQALTSKVFDLFQYEKVLQNSTIGFLLLLQLAIRGRSSLFIGEGRMASSRRAHQVEGCGLPSGESGLPLLSYQPTSVKTLQGKGEGATSLHKGLPPQEGATSPRGAHLLIPTCSNQLRYGINQHSINHILSLLTPH